jgi:hypothetical protein
MDPRHKIWEEAVKMIREALDADPVVRHERAQLALLRAQEEAIQAKISEHVLLLRTRAEEMLPTSARRILHGQYENPDEARYYRPTGYEDAERAIKAIKTGK